MSADDSDDTEASTESAEDGISPMGLVKVVTAVVGMVAAAVGLLFTLQPDLKPCLGGAEAAFTGAPVFPQDFHQFLLRNGDSTEGEGNPHGVEVRFSYRATNLRRKDLRVTYSLLRVAADGTPGAVVLGADRALALKITPDDCSQTGGKDLFIEITDPRRGQHYLVLLELYRDRGKTDRLNLTKTEVFRADPI